MRHAHDLPEKIQMPILQYFRQRIERLIATPAQELGRGARFVRFQLQLWRFCARRLWENNVSAMSAALSFRTIFALVPAIVLAVLVMKSLGMLEDSKQNLRQFLDASGFAQIAVLEEGTRLTPESTSTRPADLGKVINVAEEIESLVARVESKLTVRRIGPVGVVLLIWTALTLLTTMERSLNRIFGARRARPLARRLLLYWSALTLGPVILAAATYAGRRTSHVFENVPAVSWILGLVGWVGPVIVAILVVATFYKLLPHTRVRYRAAVGGALVFVPLWLLAKWGFAVYVSKLVGSGNLYGALGLLPLFLIWLNLSWLIFLFGAQLAHTAANLGSMQIEERSQRITTGPADLLAAAIAVARPYATGHGPTELEEIGSQLQLPVASIQKLLERLASGGIVSQVKGDSQAAYLLARPPGRIPIIEIFGVDHRSDSHLARTYAPEITRLVALAESRARADLGSYTLADVIAADTQETDRD